MALGIGKRMEKRTTAEKAIFFVLNILLILGSIITIITIDGGKWLISNPAFYEAPGEISPLIPNTGISSFAGNGESVTAQPQGACLVPAQRTQSAGNNAYLSFDAFNAAVVTVTPPAGVTRPAAICGK